MGIKDKELNPNAQPLQEGYDLYQQMIAEVLDYAIILLNRNGIIEMWNKGAEKIKGYKSEEIVGKNFAVFYSKEDRERLLPNKLLEEAVKSGRVAHEGWRLKKDGSKFWGSVVITALHNKQGNVIGFTKVTRDLTERKVAEEMLKSHALQMEIKNTELEFRNEELRRSEERYHRMIAEVQDYAILLLSKDGIVENWNKGAEKIKGYRAEEIVGKHFRIFYPEADQATKVPEKLIHEASRNGRAAHEGWRIRKDGTKFWGSTVITSLHDESNNVIGFSKVSRDLTERKQAEDKLKETAAELEEKNKKLEQMNQELTSFAYISSHDLQEPLRKIQTFATRIVEMEVGNLSEKGKDYFSRIENAAKRMQVLIEDLLAYSRTNTDQRKHEPTDLNKVLAEVKGELREKITEKQAVITSDPLPTLDVVTFQFHQLLTNLLSNSLKFSRENTPPRIEIKNRLESGAAIPLYGIDKKKNYYHISVADNGIGFAPEYETKIFEVFQRLHGRSEYSGTGIGLAICKKIVENHNGFIWAEGKPDEGATFHMLLPAN